jgi:hypothetical protein
VRQLQESLDGEIKKEVTQISVPNIQELDNLLLSDLKCRSKKEEKRCNWHKPHSTELR